MQGEIQQPAANQSLSLGYLFANWKEAILTCNLTEGRVMDGISKWIILTRGCVFSMTLTSGLIGGLLVAITPGVKFNWLNFFLSVVGILMAHAANNLINDYFDLEVGADSSENYARARYAPHPLLSGMVTKPGLRNVILSLNLLDGLIMLYFAFTVGWQVLAFALLGLFISVFYVAPPIRLKKIGLGELGVVLVWGPLMIGGTYYVTTGTINTNVLLASLPYAFLVGTVLMGKHIDKAPQDKPMGTHTLPVILGEKGALLVNQIVSVLYYVVIIGLVLVKFFSPLMLVVLLSIPMLIKTIKTYNAPKPEEYKDAPLYWVGVAFYFTRAAGFWFMVGLALNLVLPSVKLPF